MSKWSSQYKRHLPENCYAYVDAEGQGHLPVFDKSGRLSVGHLRSAMGRVYQTDLPNEAVRQAIVQDLRELFDAHLAGEHITSAQWVPVTSQAVRSNPARTQASAAKQIQKLVMELEQRDENPRNLILVAPVAVAYPSMKHELREQIEREYGEAIGNFVPGYAFRASDYFNRSRFEADLVGLGMDSRTRLPNLVYLTGNMCRIEPTDLKLAQVRGITADVEVVPPEYAARDIMMGRGR